MICPYCQQHCASRVKESRTNVEGESIRRRACGKTGNFFYTREVPDMSIVLRLNRVKKKARKPAVSKTILNKEQPRKKLPKAASDAVFRKARPNKKTREAPAIFSVWR